MNLNFMKGELLYNYTHVALNSANSDIVQTKSKMAGSKQKWKYVAGAELFI